MRKANRWKQVRHARSKERARQHRVRLLKERRTSSRSGNVPAGEIRAYAPELFALDGPSHDQVAAFLADMRRCFRSGSLSGKAVCIDFRATKKMIAGGTLLFFSELQRLVSLFPAVALRCRPSKDSVVNEVLQHLGIFSRLGYKSAIVPSRADVVSWRTVSSSEIDGEAVGSLLEKYDSLRGPVARQLFRGAGEAMFNVRHAYLASRNDGLPDSGEKKWWMFCRESKSSFAVAVCDLGIGIPRSLPIKYPAEAISKLIAKIPGVVANSDARMIHAAMQIRRSSTNLAGRGKGLSDFLRVIDAVPGSSLYIFSNRGLVRYQAGGYKRVSYRRSIKGTVVVWLVPLGNDGDLNG